MISSKKSVHNGTRLYFRQVRALIPHSREKRRIVERFERMVSGESPEDSYEYLLTLRRAVGGRRVLLVRLEPGGSDPGFAEAAAQIAYCDLFAFGRFRSHVRVCRLYRMARLYQPDRICHHLTGLCR